MPIKWTDEYIEIVQKMYPASDYEDIAALIPNLSYSALSSKASKLGLIKTIEHRKAHSAKAVAKSLQARKEKPRHKTLTEIICQSCGKTFTAKPYRKDTAKYCSSACFGNAFKGKLAGENHPRYKEINHICKGCGKTFHVKEAYDKSGKFVYCSNTCRYPAPVEISCKWCNKAFMIRFHQKRKGRKQFCSQACHGSYTVFTMQKQATSIEIAVEQVLINLNETYKAQKQMGPYIVDFYLPQYKLIIECDGTYWHKLPNVIEKDLKKDHWLASHNYKLLRISEEAIKLNAMQAVVNGMHNLNLN